MSNHIESPACACEECEKKLDIIGIVKELQKMELRAYPDVDRFNEYTLAVQGAFPRIAESLLIAVEALEKCADGRWVEAEMIGLSNEALSRIRSL
jgi:hypothetical protein